MCFREGAEPGHACAAKCLPERYALVQLSAFRGPCADYSVQRTREDSPHPRALDTGATDHAVDRIREGGFARLWHALGDSDRQEIDRIRRASALQKPRHCHGRSDGRLAGGIAWTAYPRRARGVVKTDIARPATHVQCPRGASESCKPRGFSSHELDFAPHHWSPEIKSMASGAG